MAFTSRTHYTESLCGGNICRKGIIDVMGESMRQTPEEALEFDWEELSNVCATD